MRGLGFRVEGVSQVLFRGSFQASTRGLVDSSIRAVAQCSMAPIRIKYINQRKMHNKALHRPTP